MPRGKRLDPAVLQAALEGLEFQRQRVDQQMAQVRSLLRAAPKKRPTAAQAPAKPRPRMSLAGRKRVAAAQRKRWAKVKAKQAAKASAQSSKLTKRHISAEGRRRMVEANLRRWAEYRAKKAAKEAKATAKKAQKPAVNKAVKSPA